MSFNFSLWLLILHQLEPLVQTAAQSDKPGAVLPFCRTFANPVAFPTSAVSRRGGASRVFHGGAEQRRQALRAHRRSAGQGRPELPIGAVQGESAQGEITPCHVPLFFSSSQIAPEQRVLFFFLRSAVYHEEGGVQARRFTGFLLRPRQHRQLPGLVPPYWR